MDRVLVIFTAKHQTMVNFLKIICSLLLFTVCSSTSSHENTSDAKEVQEIRKTIHGAGNALNNADIDEWVSFFSDDVVVMRPNEFSASGLKANEDRLMELFSQFVLDIDFSIKEIIVSGDWAFVRATYSETVTPINGESPFMIYGKQLNVLKKQDDESWLITRRIHNRNPGPASE